MSTKPRLTRASWPHAALAAACALAPLGACRSTTRLKTPGPVTAQTRVEAEQATKLARWEDASQLWWAVFCASDRRDAAAGAEAARALMRTGDPESALKIIDQGLAVTPHSAELHELKGDALVTQNFRRAAEACYGEAVRLDPQRTSAWRALGRTRVELGYEAAAVPSLRKAIELGSEDYATWSLLAKALDASGDPCGAFQAYTHAFKLGPGEPAQLLRASTLYLNDTVRRSNDQAAPCCEDWLERAIELKANLKPPEKFPEGHFELGVLKERQGQKDAAITHYQNALTDDATFLPALRNLALLYAQRGDAVNAAAMARRALELETNEDRRKALLRLLEPRQRDASKQPEASQPAPKASDVPAANLPPSEAAGNAR